MRILGIDPGYATIGFGLIEGERAPYRMVTYGAITTPAGLPLSKRLYQIDRDMEELIGDVYKRQDHIYVIRQSLLRMLRGYRLLTDGGETIDPVSYTHLDRHISPPYSSVFPFFFILQPDFPHVKAHG